MRVIIQRTDGGVSVMQLVGEADIDAEIEKWKELHVGEYVSHHQIDGSDLPADRTFRGAWRSDGKSLKIDMPAAREIWKDRIRSARAPKLQDLDVEFMRAVEAGTETKTIAAKKQALRDLTKDPGIEAATTPEELKAVWPAELS